MLEPYYADDYATIHIGDCIQVMRELPAESVHAVITDPPYNLSFMGKNHDTIGTPAQYQAWCQQWATEAMRVLKPGGHLIAAGGTRTYHRLAVGIEDAGFEIRDSIAWINAAGFPKSLDISKAIDKAAGAERLVTGRVSTPFKVDAAASRGTSLTGSVNGDFSKQVDENGYRYTEVTAPSTDAAKTWAGWGTALKPAHEIMVHAVKPEAQLEPLILARKPLSEGTIAGNVLRHGTGGLNIDATRIRTDDDRRRNARGGDNGMSGGGTFKIRERRAEDQLPTAGRWPANVAFDEDQAAALDQQSGAGTSARADRGKPGGVFRLDGFSNIEELRATAASDGVCPNGRNARATLARYERESDNVGGFNDSGGASRFFFTAKANQWERPNIDGVSHSTVKPLSLYRWLIRLVTPKGGTILEPFAGSGTTIEAAILEGFQIIGIEKETEYVPLIMARIARANAMAQDSLFDDAVAAEPVQRAGRWPANVVLDPGQADALDQQSGELTSGSRKAGTHSIAGLGYGDAASYALPEITGDSGGASRFFHIAQPDEDDPLAEFRANPNQPPRPATPPSVPLPQDSLFDNIGDNT